jgi:DNA-binding CsgD family transcriptional regulator
VQVDRELASGSFEAVLKAQEAETLEDLNSIVAPAAERLGYEKFIGLDVLGSGEQRRVRIVHGVNNLAWQAHYTARGFARHDAAISEVTETTEPFFRSELADRRGGLNAAETAIIEEARSFGVVDSLFIPQHHVDGSLSSVVLIASEPPDRSACARTAAHLLGVEYGLRARRLLRRERRRTASSGELVLSRRQIECLKWVRAGKSSAEIGLILNLSVRTVETYIGAACARLGVQKRWQAVTEAQARGLLPP